MANVEDVAQAFRPSGALLQAETTLAQAIELHAVASTGVNATTVDLLVRLHLSPGQRLRGVDLCRQLLKSPGYVSRLIDQAEEDGLVAREPDPTDRRAQQITLTAGGEEILDTFVPNAIDVLQETIYTALEPEEIETLIDLLVRLTKATQTFLESENP
ncbi:MAG: MarR family winged helix-turn-helix transcriptional regulator [Acidimicrobiia bacterium]